MPHQPGKALPTAKSTKKEVKVEVSPLPGVSYHVNRFSSYTEGDMLVLCFGYEGKFRLRTEDILVSVQKSDAAKFLTTLGTFANRFHGVQPLDSVGWVPQNATRVIHAPIIHMAQNEGKCETTFSNFLMHHAIQYARGGEGAVEAPKAVALLSLYSDIRLQFSVLKALQSWADSKS